MAVTQNQTRDSWLREPYTTDGWLSYTMNQDGTTAQQHPGNGVSLSSADGDEAIRFSVAKTQKSYSPQGLQVICGSRVYSMTPQMRQAYAASTNGTSNNGGRDLDRDRLASTAGDCA